MGKFYEQESEATPLSLQMQVVGSHAMKIPAATVTNNVKHLRKDYKDCLIVAGSPSKLPYTEPPNNFFQQEMIGSFPNPPTKSMLYNITAFSDNDEIFFRSLNVDSSNHLSHVSNYISIIKANGGKLRQCPGGQQGGTSGGNTHNTSTGTANTGNGASWVLTGSYSGGLLGGMGGAGGGNGDDDPWRNQQPNSSGPLPSLLLDDEFNSTDYLDDAVLADIIRDLPLYDLVINSASPVHAGVYRDHSHNSWTNTDTSDPPSTPAPLTPLTPMPNTPSYHRIQSPASIPSLSQTQVQTNYIQQPSDNSDTLENLLAIQRLIINSKDKCESDMRNSTTLVPTPVPQPSSMQSYPNNTLLHQAVSQPPSFRPSLPPTRPQPANGNAIDFLTTETTTINGYRMIDLFVPNNAPLNKREIGFRALDHCYKVYLEYSDALKNASFSELQVAVREIAHLCDMEVGNSGQPRLHFKMPSTCVHLNQWMSCDHSIDKRQIVLQQLINTLTILFKAQNNLCFWGSAEIWVDTNLRLYLYIDFIKALAIQKDYAENGLQCNPRVEDCKILNELYKVTLKPFLQQNFNWISPHLTTVFNTFEQLLNNPENCVSNMAYVARVFGERRICKLQCNVMVGVPLQYTVYCAEHETVSSSLPVLAGVLPTFVARWWVVMRSHNDSYVGITDMATKEAEGSYTIYPMKDSSPSMPGALYIESKQQCY